MSEAMRLQRYLAQAGVASRRKAEVLISDGRVSVNGKVVTALGTKVQPGKDRVRVDGKAVAREKPAYVVLNKPGATITTLDDPEGRDTVADLLPREPRLFPIGRLDYHTEGVLLCTNDGALAQKLGHPSGGVRKVYRVRVRGTVNESQLEQFTMGIPLDDGLAKADRVLGVAETRSHTWLEVTVHEGRNRLIRRMCEALELPVMRLIRTSFAGITTEGLRPGEWRHLNAKEVRRLKGGKTSGDSGGGGTRKKKRRRR